MNSGGGVISGVFALRVLAGCASTQVIEKTGTSPELARPNQIGVYDFVADPATVPADSSSVGP